ncbi:hypothetical protein [Chryseobacterium sp. JK1]|uniref:hypothetical protein n=1 Tax=Chryseobacterium sp. JK1 TaxID=874294 RepID=UPI003D6914CD
MKKTLLSFNLILSLSLFGQSVVIVPNTENYGQNGIVYNNSLFFSKNSKLAKFDGVSVIGLPEPSYSNQPINGLLRGSMVIYNNKLCYNYDYKASGSMNEYLNKDYIVTYDGSEQKAFLNPESVYEFGGIYIGGTGSESEPVLYNNKLVFRGTYYNGLTSHLYTFDGQNILKINNINNNNMPGAVLKLGNQATIYNNELYFGYKDNNMFFDGIGKFDGTTIQTVTNSSQEYLGGLVNLDTKMYCYLHGVGYGLGLYGGNTFSSLPIAQARFPSTIKPLVFNSKIYFTTSIYVGTEFKNKLVIFDGTNFQIVNNINAVDNGPSGPVINFANDIYFKYAISSGNYQLAKYSGTSISLISNVISSNSGVNDAFIEFNNALFCTYRIGGSNKLVKYDGTNLTVLPNPDNGEGVQENFVVYGNDLYFPYKNEAGTVVLAKYGSTVLSTVENSKNENISIYKDNKGFSVVSKSKKINKIEIVDASGRLIYDTKVGNEKYYFEIEAKGVFIFKAVLNDGKVFTQKIRN